MAEPEAKAEPMLVLSAGTPDMLLRPCSDCGLRTGNFCEARQQKNNQRWQGGGADDSGGGTEQVFRMDRMSVVDPLFTCEGLQRLGL